MRQRRAIWVGPRRSGYRAWSSFPRPPESTPCLSLASAATWPYPTSSAAIFSAASSCLSTFPSASPSSSYPSDIARASDSPHIKTSVLSMVKDHNKAKWVKLPSGPRKVFPLGRCVAVEMSSDTKGIIRGNSSGTLTLRTPQTIILSSSLAQIILSGNVFPFPLIFLQIKT